MKKNELPESDVRYTQKCECGKEITLYTQKDNEPEYYTDICIKCECGGFLAFELPVN